MIIYYEKLPKKKRNMLVHLKRKIQFCYHVLKGLKDLEKRLLLQGDAKKYKPNFVFIFLRNISMKIKLDVTKISLIII